MLVTDLDRSMWWWCGQLIQRVNKKRSRINGSSLKKIVWDRQSKRYVNFGGYKDSHKTSMMMNSFMKVEMINDE